MLFGGFLSGFRRFGIVRRVSGNVGRVSGRNIYGVWKVSGKC